MISLLDVAASFCNRAANYQSWKQDLVARLADRLVWQGGNVRRGQDILATISLAFAPFSKRLASLLSPPHRQTANPERSSPPFPTGVLDSLHFVFYLPPLLPPALFHRRFLPHFQGGSTAPCWQLFRVLKRPMKKF